MKTIAYKLAVAVLLLPAAIAIAGECYDCPDCGAKICRPVEVEKEEKKHGYEVEHKEICVPSFCWPWQKCCKPKCGKVKTVKVLKKVEYKCKVCGCKWELQKVDCGCNCDNHGQEGAHRQEGAGHQASQRRAPPTPPANARSSSDERTGSTPPNWNPFTWR
ncbi:MAG: hypothetical protein DWQ31_18235 [Planctomycetota bacterium]|nr:MAG: hypothetical protein DWQ31_18235 [Planctomycetota bacterium]REJ92295.1 MAG: hypothetical protein DWQ35_12525 [Planctomycetota bacterium]REK24701.1 MAG: hypothetical protein DWQ42_13310 [Planctomycetota bacterium]REK40200.1 MAG: hypothetical protein DWQ46_17235 [Planctomycetota bacterium]